jgi:hypothetical protein
MRRFKAYECIDTLRRYVAPMLSNRVNALLLPPASLARCVHTVSRATGDLAAELMRPPPATPIRYVEPGNQATVASRHPAGVASLQPRQQQADRAVLHLMLSARVMELLAALVLLVNVHTAQLARACQHAQELGGAGALAGVRVCPTVRAQVCSLDCSFTRFGAAPALLLPCIPPPHNPHAEPAGEQQQQLQQLATAQADLLSSIKTLAVNLAANSAGWSFLQAAREGLAQLAEAVCPLRQVCVRGWAAKGVLRLPPHKRA